jgi:hypothetical protein
VNRIKIVTSFDISLKLLELGFKQSHHFYWREDGLWAVGDSHDPAIFDHYGDNYKIPESEWDVAAYTFGELIDLIIDKSDIKEFTADELAKIIIKCFEET